MYCVYFGFSKHQNQTFLQQQETKFNIVIAYYTIYFAYVPIFDTKLNRCSVLVLSVFATLFLGFKADGETLQFIACGTNTKTV